MPNGLRLYMVRAAKTAVTAVPWIASMYLFYWLDSSGTWTADTPHRGKLSVLIMSTGVTLSLLLFSSLFKKNER